MVGASDAVVSAWAARVACDPADGRGVVPAELGHEVADAAELVAHPALHLVEPGVGRLAVGGEVPVAGGEPGGELLPVQHGRLFEGPSHRDITLGGGLLTQHRHGPFEGGIGGRRGVPAPGRRHRERGHAPSAALTTTASTTTTTTSMTVTLRSGCDGVRGWFGTAGARREPGRVGGEQRGGSQSGWASSGRSAARGVGGEQRGGGGDSGAGGRRPAHAGRVAASSGAGGWAGGRASDNTTRRRGATGPRAPLTCLDREG